MILIKRKGDFIMNLKNILNGIEGLKAKGNLDLDISNIECDYRKITR